MVILCNNNFYMIIMERILCTNTIIPSSKVTINVKQKAEIKTEPEVNFVLKKSENRSQF